MFGVAAFARASLFSIGLVLFVWLFVDLLLRKAGI